MMMAISSMLDRPAMARTPRTESIQRMRSTAAISRKGLGRIFMITPTASKMSTSQRVIGIPLIVRRVMCGMLRIPILR